MKSGKPERLEINSAPALIAEYQTMLPDKKLLQGKLNELYNQNASEEDG
jgi:hypothetical protein